MDDGYGGTRFERPSRFKLIEKTETGEASALSVKAMSQLGCDSLKTGFYAEAPSAGKRVRFIAIHNGMDGANQQGGGFPRFSTASTSGIPKGTSKKICAAMKGKGEAEGHLRARPMGEEKARETRSGELWTKRPQQQASRYSHLVWIGPRRSHEC